MAPFAICTNPICAYFQNLFVDRPLDGTDNRRTDPCPLCGSSTTDRCPHCQQDIYYPGPNGTLSQCDHCRKDMRGVPARFFETEAEEKRLTAALKCLDELIALVMERIAAQANLDPEELSEACRRGIPAQD